MKVIKVAQMGLGPIGARIAKLLLEKESFALVAASDIDPVKQGKDLGELIQSGKPTGIRVVEDLLPILKEGKVDVVSHATVSSLAAAAPQIEACINGGAHVVSTTEELSFPVGKNVEIAARLNELAIETGKVILGTGVNPGYVMDLLPIILSAPCQRIERVFVKRVQDAALRRKPLQEKVGAGMTEERFAQEIASSRGHVGLSESMGMIASGLGWKLDDFKTSIEPVLAPLEEEPARPRSEAGRVLGIHQIARGYRGEREVITLELFIYLGAPNPVDLIHIHGEPEVKAEIKGGLNGDLATVSIAVNSISVALSTSPGLKSMLDIPPPRFVP
jgi:4-hydroxy-tetrahydrodipicolinate reductase